MLVAFSHVFVWGCACRNARSQGWQEVYINFKSSHERTRLFRGVVIEMLCRVIRCAIFVSCLLHCNRMCCWVLLVLFDLGGRWFHWNDDIGVGKCWPTVDRTPAAGVGGEGVSCRAWP